MEEMVEELKNQIKSHEERISKLEDIIFGGQGQVDKPTITKKLSIREFLHSFNVQTDVQKILAIGYYLEKYKQMPSFNVDDLRNEFNAAKEPKPSNIHAFVNQNIINRHIMVYDEKKDNKKAFVLTNSGERFVENELKGD